MICHPGDIVSTVSGDGAVYQILSSDFADAPIGVFWLTDDCGVPIHLDLFQVSENIKKALWYCNHRGRVDIGAYGYNDQLEPELAGRELQFLGDHKGVVFSLFLPGEASKETMLKKLFVDILVWTWHNPPPAHILFIAGDMTLHNYGLLYKLKLQEGYNILLGSLPKPDPTITDCEFRRIKSTLWYWNRLCCGEFPVIVSLPILPGSNEAHLEGDVSLKGRFGPGSKRPLTSD